MNSTIDELKLIRASIDRLTDIASSTGNWDCSDYLRGMCNGLILAQHIVYTRIGVPPYKEAMPEHAYYIGESKLNFLTRL